MLRSLLLACLSAGLLAACAAPGAPPIYAPAAADARGIGYDAFRLDARRWRVWFTAEGETDPAVLERYAIRRAAEVTLQNGYDWFVVEDRDRFRHDRDARPDGLGGLSNAMRTSEPIEEGRIEATRRRLTPFAGALQSVSVTISAGRGPRPGGAYDPVVVIGSYAG